MKLLILNGPNLNMLGIREPEIYGHQTYADLVSYLRDVCAEQGIEADIRQTNSEGTMVDFIQEAYRHADGIVINPAAYTHTSVAILDALKAVGLPAVEVHLSRIDSREPFRRFSYTAQACLGQVQGKGFEGYREAILLLKEHIEKEEKSSEA